MTGRKSRRPRIGCLVAVAVVLALCVFDDYRAYCRLCGKKKDVLLVTLPVLKGIPIHSSEEQTPLSELLEPLCEHPHQHDWVVYLRPRGFGGCLSRWLCDLEHGGYRAQQRLMNRRGYLLGLLAQYDPQLTLAIAQRQLYPYEDSNDWRKEQERFERLAEECGWWGMSGSEPPDPGGLCVARRAYELPPLPQALRERLEAARAAWAEQHGVDLDSE